MLWGGLKDCGRLDFRFLQFSKKNSLTKYIFDWKIDFYLEYARSDPLQKLQGWIFLQ